MNNFKYKKVKNFLSRDELNLLTTYCKLRHKTNFNTFQFNHFGSKNCDTSFYGDCMMESTMLNKLQLMEQETGLELLPTYSFWRCYTKFADLAPHSDRPSCEYSVTVMIDSDKTDWPIVIDDKSFTLERGDALIYKGCDFIHKRDEFHGDYHMQAFLHYVDKQGPNKEWHLDKRLMLGMPPNK
jgi:hypothetical protein|tara:strand:- start:32 stop:580 length:549 start_codon:yes stop_codon:yes gene_type:complete